ncbi:hypothetical protein PHJA_002376400 [Phtheirospermum japonicum]|uniref:rRNA-processing protein FYV7 n=1 Tax=Phtheirospermum japonicum TaxID=374723 RepID=A0A830D2B6_9LAMI|nr:hypothetical protein PHJA_002376400 [Phtheirospermum japonicum]
MKKGGEIADHNETQGKKTGSQGVIKNKTKMKKNMQRLGGRGGLSLESFANAKTRNANYNPSLIKKQREFYKNAKYVQKYKKSLKQQEQLNIPTDKGPIEGENQTNEGGHANRGKMGKKNARSLGELYERKRDEEEKARMERDAIIQAKNEERQRAETRRRALKEKMYKKTKSGQPVMKYRIEHLLETIQGPTS